MFRNCCGWWQVGGGGLAANAECRYNDGNDDMRMYVNILYMYVTYIFDCRLKVMFVDECAAFICEYNFICERGTTQLGEGSLSYVKMWIIALHILRLMLFVVLMFTLLGHLWSTANIFTYYYLTYFILEIHVHISMYSKWLRSNHCLALA